MVTLTAEPEDGWEFSGWSGEEISGNQNTLTIVMNSDKDVTALLNALQVMAIWCLMGISVMEKITDP